MKTYEDLCKNITKITTDERYLVDLQCIPQLCIPRNRPEYIIPFLSMVSSEREYWRNLLKELWCHIRAIASGIFRLIMSARDLVKMSKEPACGNHEQVDVLIFSHLRSRSQSVVQDMYFGDLFNTCRDLGLTVKFVYFNTAGIRYKCIPEILKANSIVIAVRESFGTEAYRYLTAIIRAIKIATFSLFNRNACCRQVLRRAALFSLSNAALDLSMKRGIFKEIFTSVRPKYMFLNQEGLAWERICILSLREKCPQSVAISYQHVPLFRSSYSILSDYRHSFSPDHILFSSKVYADLFNELNGDKYPLSRQHIYGNHRISKINNVDIDFSPRNTIILLPQAFHSEVELFRSLGDYLACKFSSFSVNMTIHPLMKDKYADVTKRLFGWKNIKIVENAAALRMAPNCFVILSASSSYIPFCSHGALPIIFEEAPGVGYDTSPIFALDSNTPVASTFDQIAEILSNYDAFISRSQVRSLCSKIGNLYDPIQKKVIRDLLVSQQE